jgi:hypothetical protein
MPGKLMDPKVVQADVTPADSEQTDSEEMVRRVRHSPDLGNGSIIDLHDGSGAEGDTARLRRPILTITPLPKRFAGARVRAGWVDAMECDQPGEGSPRARMSLARSGPDGPSLGAFDRGG